MEFSRILIIILVTLGLASAALVVMQAAAQDDDSADNPIEMLGSAVSEIGAGVAAHKEADSPHMKWLAIASIIAAGLKILLSLLKLTGAAVFKNKYFLKIAPLVVGLLIFVFGQLALDEPWWVVVILSLGGPGAILVHEVWKVIPVLQDAKE